LTEFQTADFSRLPAPEDDGAADQLPGRSVPDWLPGGGETLVAFVYPATGTPGKAMPEGWDEIPGARGCTPQSCAFRDHHAELAELGATVVGVSAQPAEEQREFAEREQLPYELVNDSGLRLAGELGLPTFSAEGRELYRRLTFVARGGKIVKVFYPVFPPDRNAADVADWLRENPAA
jgi:peroxiredoxin